MLLSVPMIVGKLAQQFALSEVLCGKETVSLQPPRLIRWGEPMKPDVIYVVSEEADVENVICPDTGLAIFCCGAIPSNYINRGLSLISFSAEQRPEDVLNCIQDIFEEYNAWDAELQHILNHGKGLQAMLDISVPVLGNALSVSDSSLHVLAYSLDYSAGQDEERNRLLMEHRNSPENINKLWGDLKKFRALREPYDYAADNFGFPTISQNLFDGQVYIGNLNLLGNRPFRPQDYLLLSHLGRYVQYALLREHAGDTHHLGRMEDLFRSLLERRSVDAEEVTLLWHTAGFHPEDSYQCLVIELPSQPPHSMIHFLRRQIISLLPATVAFEYHQQIAVFINRSQAILHKPQYLNEFILILEKLGLKAGQSDDYQDIFRSRYYYAEAMAALKLGLEEKNPESIYNFQDYCNRFILRHCVGDLTADMLYPIGLKRLMKHDESAGVSYIETLRVYLDENMNTVKTAKRLCIQRNSLLGRLERLKALLALDLHDPEVRLRLSLCLRLLTG